MALRAAQAATCATPPGAPAALFFSDRICWNPGTGFGGPASPRGYVDPGARPAPPPRTPVSGADASPRAAAGRAPDVFREGRASTPTTRRWTSPSWAPGRGAQPCRALGPASVVAFDAGPFFRPLEDFASDEESQSQLYWLDERIVDGADPLKMGGNNCGKAVGDRALRHALRFRPDFKARSRYGWPGARCGVGTRALHLRPVPAAPAGVSVAAPVNAAGDRVRAAHAAGHVSAPHGKRPWRAARLLRGSAAPPTPSRARSSRRAKGGPRDLAMVGRIEPGVHYHREGGWRFQKARNVAVCGYGWPGWPPGGNLPRAWPAWASQRLRAWNYDDSTPFPGRLHADELGRMPQEWAGMWAPARRRREMTEYNHQTGIKVVGPPADLRLAHPPWRSQDRFRRSPCRPRRGWECIGVSHQRPRRLPSRPWPYASPTAAASLPEES